MEGLNYGKLVQKILEDNFGSRKKGKTEIQLIFDSDRDRYLVLNLGWLELNRVFGCIVYIQIKDGKIWIERDGTEVGIANELVAAGVPKNDIVLAFQAPYKREFTEFAVG
ncbi:XisI protein [Microseira wollei]|uniref:XisI protein n=1 Tax=Microseira wollei NIES-4236 TaxID=2530354 RepID=A0AAV3X8M9_9CYAN|nr:XisI protein [Microseira wollei]GET36719.1 XisI protein [Microseira wollei NIES-4236]